ncbi:hypothetical protein FE257_006694 [Aspergillus nanangensis]|uniref:PD-(D/E)XK nuclease-like domain-containing protein n=1 Tax=Aspergillus nanangensis TaxID=2582783 RepID=A0AAD4CNX6_ASPNN|nr:hypothetical protein FE257_006694 [Aspergillus nanangensis]
MHCTTSIHNWIRHQPDVYDYPPERTRKRRPVAAACNEVPQLASPPPSLEGDTDWEMASTPKRRCVKGPGDSHALVDLDTTPRPVIANCSERSASETSSTTSRTPSTRRQMMSLRLSESGVECKALDVDAPPDTAQNLVTTMEEIGRALEILPHALESTIMEKVRKRNLDHRKWRHSFKSAENEDGLPGRIPTFEEVEKIHRKANECLEFNHEEASWNNQVHLRLLESIFEEVLGGQCDQFNAISCTTARPHREFKPALSPVKMIDICVYASVDQDAELSASMTKFRSITPTQTVNHTDFEPISMRPLLLSIETKKPGVHWDTAQLQIGSWHAAQWSFLRWAVGQKLRRQRVERLTEIHRINEEEEAFRVDELAVLSSLGALPGIIVQGHRWLLVLSTYENGKTKLWTDHQFGTTQSCLDIYAVIAGMRQLTAWARDVYLPWFKASILN